MPSYSDREREALETYRAYVDQHTRARRGEVAWSSIGDFFTEDCVFIDPAWGRIEGRAKTADFFDWSIVGLEGLEFPEVWTMADGDRIVSFWWCRLPGAPPEGSRLKLEVRRKRLSTTTRQELQCFT